VIYFILSFVAFVFVFVALNVQVPMRNVDNDTGAEVLFNVQLPNLSIADIWPEGNAPPHPTKMDAYKAIQSKLGLTNVAVNKKLRYSPRRHK
jgi:hypothetical protein